MENNKTSFDGIKRESKPVSSPEKRSYSSSSPETSQHYSNSSNNIDNIEPIELDRYDGSSSEYNPPPKQKSKWGGVALEVVKFALIALLIVVPIRVFVAQPFIVNGASMDPTFATGQYLIVDQISNRFEDPDRGSIVVFKYPRDPSKFFIKRVIGLPEETVRITDGVVRIINEDSPDGFVLEEPYVTHTKEENMEITLKDGEYFVLGDNRAGSSDSRIWGPLDEDLITGRALIRLLPFNKIEVFPGRH